MEGCEWSDVSERVGSGGGAACGGRWVDGVLAEGASGGGHWFGLGFE